MVPDSGSSYNGDAVLSAFANAPLIDLSAEDLEHSAEIETAQAQIAAGLGVPGEEVMRRLTERG